MASLLASSQGAMQIRKRRACKPGNFVQERINLFRFNGIRETSGPNS